MLFIISIAHPKRWRPDGQSRNGNFVRNDDRKATQQKAVNITEEEYKVFWITVNEVTHFQSADKSV